MKQLFLTGLLVGSALFSAQAQSGYDDDIYSDRPAAPKPQASSGYDNSGNYSNNSGNYNNNNDGYGNNGGSYNSGSGSYNSGNYADDYDYIDYADDYSYATRFRRFDAPFYNVGYWSGFWSPFNYDPFWGSPWYGGYSNGGWGRPGVYVSINMGGPYWSSGWGYNTWYGYGGFSSYWGYPHYGGWGHGGGGYGYGYRNGYWDGYYAGLYGAGYGYTPYAYRTVNYAPRTAIGGVNGYNYRTPVNIGNRSAVMSNSDLRGTRSFPGSNSGNAPAPTTPSNTRLPDRNIRTTDNNTAAEIRTPSPDRNNGNIAAPDRNVRESVVAPAGTDRNTRGSLFGNNDRAVESPAPTRNNSINNARIVETPAPTRNNGNTRGGWFSNGNDRAAEVAPSRETTRPQGGFFGNSDRAAQQQQQQPPVRNNDGWQNQRSTPDRGFSAPQQIERREMPRFERPQQMEAPRSQPRFEAPAPRMSAPSGGFSAPRSAPAAPSGGGFGGSRGGGGFRR